MGTVNQDVTRITAGLEPALLRRLAALDARGHPILSVYLDLDPSRFPTPAALDGQLGALLSQTQRDADAGEAAHLAAWLANDRLAGHRLAGNGARGLAIYSSARANIAEVVRLPVSVEPLAVQDVVPWLEPLAAIISPGPWAVAVLSRRSARLLRGGPRGLSEFATIDDDVYRRHAQGGWSQSRFQRGIDEQVAAHVRAVVARLLRAHRRLPFAHLVIVCSGELRPIVERSLPSELADLQVSSIEAGLEHASLDEILRAVTPAMVSSERDRETRLAAAVDDALGTGGPAAAGCDDVLSAFREHRVEVLLVGTGAALSAGRCPTCGGLWAGSVVSCPLDHAPLARVDATEHAIDEAARQSAEVVVVHHLQPWLQSRGSIAALLRW